MTTQPEPAIDAPPTQSLPSRRAATLTDAFSRALEATSNKISYQNFATCFPTPAQYKPDTLQKFHGDFVGRWGDRCKSQFDAILADREVVKGLNALDGLVGDANERMKAAEARGESMDGRIPYVHPLWTWKATD
jgi:kinetochore protein NNF1